MRRNRKWRMFMLYLRFYLSRIKEIFIKPKEQEPINFIYENHRDEDERD